MTAEDVRSATAQLQPLVGQSLSQLCLGVGDAQLRFSDGATVSVENAITVAGGEGQPVVPYALHGVAVLLPLLNGEVDDVGVEADGALSLTLAGTALRCGPDPDFESWQVSGRGVGLVVCLPGGDLAIWQA